MARMPTLPPLVYGSGRPPETLLLAEAKRDFAAFRDKLPEWRETILSELRKGGVGESDDPARFLDGADKWLADRVAFVRDPLPHDRHHKDLDARSDLACRYVGILFGDRLVAACPEASWRVGPLGKRYYMRHAPVVGVDWGLIFWPGIVSNFFRAWENEGRHSRHRAKSLRALYESWMGEFTPDLSPQLRAVLSPSRDRSEPVDPETSRLGIESIDLLLQRRWLPVAELMHAGRKRFEDDRRWRTTLLDLRAELVGYLPANVQNDDTR